MTSLRTVLRTVMPLYLFVSMCFSQARLTLSPDVSGVQSPREPLGMQLAIPSLRTDFPPFAASTEGHRDAGTHWRGRGATVRPPLACPPGGAPPLSDPLGWG